MKNRNDNLNFDYDIKIIRLCLFVAIVIIAKQKIYIKTLSIDLCNKKY